MTAALDMTDAAAAANRVNGRDGEGEQSAPSTVRKRGRPSGSKTRPKETPKAAEREAYRATPEGIAGAALLASTLFRIVGPMVGCSPLTEEEATEVGKAIDPLLFKYVPMVGEWREELNAVVVLVGVVGVSRARFVQEQKARSSHADTEARETEAVVLD